MRKEKEEREVRRSKGIEEEEKRMEVKERENRINRTEWKKRS